MSTCLDLQTLESQPIMFKNLLEHWLVQVAHACALVRNLVCVSEKAWVQTWLLSKST